MKETPLDLPGGRRFKHADAAKFLGIASQTLNAGRNNGTINIPFYRIGTSRNSHVLYLEDDLQAYLDSKRVEQGAA